ncbi:MAG: class I SAM-dependent methyltransferase [Acidimicrobiales bacterium]|jgi:SAM-dependent methyltransferase
MRRDKPKTRPSRRSHPIFARLYGWFSPRSEKAGTGVHREELLSGLTGRVVEVGAGNGLNFAHYPPGVDSVTAYEPESHLRRLAELAAATAPVPIEVSDAAAEHIPAADAAFDAAVVSLVLCSVADQGVALAELYRVLRPNGELRFYEHVRSGNRKRARLQDRVDPLWSSIFGGCHPNRDTEAAIVAAGFVVERCHRFNYEPVPLTAPVAPVVIGVARRVG